MLSRMSSNARRFARPEAAQRIARSLLEWARHPKGKPGTSDAAADAGEEA